MRRPPTLEEAQPWRPNLGACPPGNTLQEKRKVVVCGALSSSSFSFLFMPRKALLLYRVFRRTGREARRGHARATPENPMSETIRDTGRYDEPGPSGRRTTAVDWWGMGTRVGGDDAVTFVTDKPRARPKANKEEKK